MGVFEEEISLMKKNEWILLPRLKRAFFIINRLFWKHKLYSFYFGNIML